MSRADTGVSSESSARQDLLIRVGVCRGRHRATLYDILRAHLSRTCETSSALLCEDCQACSVRIPQLHTTFVMAVPSMRSSTGSTDHIARRPACHMMVGPAWHEACLSIRCSGHPDRHDRFVRCPHGVSSLFFLLFDCRRQFAALPPNTRSALRTRGGGRRGDSQHKLGCSPGGDPPRRINGMRPVSVARGAPAQTWRILGSGRRRCGVLASRSESRSTTTHLDALGHEGRSRDGGERCRALRDR